MRAALYSAALVGAALVSAMPTDQQNSNSNGNDNFDDNKQPFPLQDGFPNPNDQQLLSIERNAHGTLSNVTADPKAPPLSNDTIISLQLIATNELLETDFFENFLLNVTEKRPGFDKFDSDDDYRYIVDTLTQFVGIEQVHAINANNALKSQGFPPIQPAQYVFPVNNITDAFNLANALTDGVLSTLQEVIRRLADDGDNSLINGVVAVVGDEGEQDGYIRYKQGRTPAAQPFLTGGDRRFAFSVLENYFIVPGTDKNDIDLPVFKPLNVDTKNIQPMDQKLQFSIPLNTIPGNANVGSSPSSYSGSSPSHRRARHVRRHEQDSQYSSYSATSTSSSYASSSTSTSSSHESNDHSMGGNSVGNNNHGRNDYHGEQYNKDYDWKSSNLALISEQNVPIVVPIENIQIESDKITFEAFFPGRTNFLDAFTIAAVVNSAGPFVSPVDVANHTIAGPGFIEATD